MPNLPTSPGDRLARLSAMFEAAPIGITAVDPDGHLLECNPAYERLLGYSADELRSRHFAALSDPGVANENIQRMREMAEGRRDTFTLEKSYRRKDGETIWVRLTAAAVRDVDGALQYVVGMVEDVTERRQMRQALRESEQLHRSILESLPVIAYRADAAPPFTPLYVSAGAETLGYSLDEWFGPEHVWLNRMHPDDRERVLDAAARARETGEGTDLEYRLLAPDGTERWFRDKGTMIRDEPGAAAVWQGVMLDITARREAEAALRSSEALFRSITEHSVDLITIIDADWRFRYVSPSVERTLGWTAAELGEIGFRDLVHPDDLPAVARTMEHVLEEAGRRDGVRLRMRTKQGTWRVIDGSGINMLHHPSIGGIVGTSRDVTEQIKAENDLRFQAHVLDVVDQAVVVIGATGHVIYWNRRAQSIFGWTGQDLRGADYMTLAYPDPTAEDAGRFEAVLRGETLEGRERRLRRLDGTTFLAHVAASPYMDASGQPAGAVAIVTDITERRHLEDQLRQSQKMEAVGQLAGGVAHDFNNILTVISGRAEFLRAALPGSDDWREDVDEVLQAASRASRLTRQLLAFSRKQMLQPRRLRLDDVVRDMAPMLDRLIGEDIELAMRLGEPARNVHADPRQLEQILVNLAVNARDAMPLGGVLAITTRLEHLRPRSQLAREHDVAPGEYIVLTVSDTGVGMDHETTARVFEPFFTTKEPGHGTGLGLSTVYGVVKQSGGFITVRSKPMAGTTFEVYLPAVAVPTSETAAASPSPHKRGGCETILLVEDSDPVRRIAERVLRDHGYCVLTARNGGEALKVAAEHDGVIDLLLTDVVMPRMSGRQLAETLATQRPGIRTLYTSGYTDDVIIRKGLNVPGHAFLEKPFTSSALAARVRALLDDAATP